MRNATWDLSGWDAVVTDTRLPCVLECASDGPGPQVQSLVEIRKCPGVLLGLGTRVRSQDEAGPPEVEALGVGVQPRAWRHLGSHLHPEHGQHVEPVGVRNITPRGRVHGHRVVEGVTLGVRHLVPAPGGLGARVGGEPIPGASRVVKSRERLHPRDVNGAAEVPVADRERHLRVRFGQHDVVPLDDRSSVDTAHFRTACCGTARLSFKRMNSPLRWEGTTRCGSIGRG